MAERKRDTEKNRKQLIRKKDGKKEKKRREKGGQWIFRYPPPTEFTAADSLSLVSKVLVFGGDTL